MVNEHFSEAFQTLIRDGLNVDFFHQFPKIMIPKVLAYVPDSEVAAAFVACFFAGCLDGVKICFARLGGDLVDVDEVSYDKLKVKRLPTGIGSRHFDEIELDMSSWCYCKMRSLRDGNEMNELMAIVREATGKDLLQPSFFSYCISFGLGHPYGDVGWDDVHDMNIHPGWGQGFAVPKLIGGKVIDSDVADILKSLSDRPGVDPLWFQTMYCMTDEATIAAHPEQLRPLDVEITINLGTKAVRGPKAIKLLSDVDWVLHNRSSAYLSWNLKPRGWELTCPDVALLNSLADKITATGGVPQGLVVCQTSVEFLLSHETSSVQGYDCHRAMEGYTPLTLFMSTHRPVEEPYTQSHVYHLRDFFTSRRNTVPANTLFLNRVEQYLEPAYNAFLNDADRPLRWSEFLELRNGDDYTFRGRKVILDLDGGDYIRSSESIDPGVLDHCNLEVKYGGFGGSCWEQIREILKACSPTTVIQGIPVTIPDEDLFALAIEVGMKERGARQEVVHGLMRERSFEGMIARCKTKDHWGVMHCIYGDAYLEPHIHELPDNRVTRLAVQGFGI